MKKNERSSVNYCARGILVALTVAGGLWGGNLYADIIADFRDDFVADHDWGDPAVGIPDTRGTGRWWYYGSETANPTDLGANLQLLDWDGSQQYGEGDYSLPHVRSDNLHPTDEADVHYAVVRWESGTSGLFEFDGFFERNADSTSGDGVDVWVYSNGELVFAGGLDAESGHPSAPFSFSDVLSAGEYVDFVVGPRDTRGHDRTRFSVTIVPEPTTWAMLMFGAAALALVRRRRRARV